MTHADRDLCIEAKRLGIDFGETMFWWNKHKADAEYKVSDGDYSSICGHWDSVPCPTADEVADILPRCVHRKSEMPWYLTIRKVIQTVDIDEWVVTYEREKDNFLASETDYDGILVNALIRMAIYLKKEGLLPVEKEV